MIYTSQEWAPTSSPMFYHNMYPVLAKAVLEKLQCKMRLHVFLAYSTVLSVHGCVLYCRANVPSPSSVQSTAILPREPQWKTDEAGSCGTLVSK